MNLLPRSHTEFTSPEYWDSFFKKRGRKAFEWYGEYNNLCGILHKYIKPADKVLMVGCGNSRLSEDMYDVGYHGIVNIDVSDIVIRQMTERNRKREEMSFVKMDVTQMSYEEGTFSVAVDKGTLDALAVDQEEATLATVNAMFREVSRVLRLGGRYIIISLLQEQVIQALVKHFAETSWPIRIHRVDMEKGDGDDGEFSLPVFAVVLTKFKALPNMKQIVEVCSGEDSPQRLESSDHLLTTVKEMQYYGLVRQQLAHSKPQAEQLQISLYSHLGSCARYTLWVVDSDKRCSNKFAIFIVPQGRETEWTFCTDAGRSSLSSSAGFERLVVVALSREHEYKDMESVKAELSCKVMELAPSSYRKGVQVPFLSIGEDIGSRTVRHRGHSELSGDYIVEDTDGDGGHIFRRLIFLTNQNVVQSEVRLLGSSSGKKRKQKKGSGGRKSGGGQLIDQSYLACQHHHAMLAGLAFLPPQVTEPQVLLVGLGGGLLAAFLNQHFPQVCLEVVEIDAEMSRVASEWFGFHHNNKVNVRIADGLDLIAQLAEKGEKRQVVMFDVDSKDTSLGLSCPPPAFLTPQFLTTTAQILDDGGVFVLNLVCRDEALQKSVMDRIGAVFPCVMAVDIPQEVNRVVFAYKSAQFSAAAAAAASSSIATPDAANGTCDGGVSQKPNAVAKSECVAGLQRELLERLGQSAKRLDRQIRSVSASCDVVLAECVADLQQLTV
ncbi:eEF1A lysine and N-terminal methyltransferase-like [Babylonia areolata]|uniref:eEF1A lysine and N-terminal methyltransferase-like n=1 Tax=Babylonia areolata TaxID=304850 RepID=UPI003FD583EE